MNPNFRTPNKAPKRLSQAENREYRRASLLKAAISTVARYDIEGATVERICSEAGASRGLIAHYFESKESLLLAALENWFRTALEIKSHIASDAELSAEQRIREIAYSSVSAPSYSWEIASAWQAFTNASRHNTAYAKPIRDASRYATRLIAPLFSEAANDLGVELDAKEAAMGLYILDDGLWNSLATGKDKLTLVKARACCDRYIDGCLRK
ncbi:MAG: TetR family transcriptional regulator C-terminal domain-containing protein [bacterium]